MNITPYYAMTGEKPLDVIKPDGGFTGIFRTIACVGDSLSSGEFESTQPGGGKGYHDYYDYSWGQYIARAAGCKVYNFSRGGMTASAYMNGWGESNDVFNPEKAAQAYIFALGVNDVLNQNQEVGSIGDIDLENPDNNKPTFAGYMGKVLSAYKKIQPKARFFLMTMPKETAGEDPRADKKLAHRKLLYDLCTIYEFAYVIDLWEFGPIYDEQFKYNFYLGGHLNAAGYLLTAQMVMSYIDYIIRHNPEDFAQVGFVGTEFHNETRKW